MSHLYRCPEGLSLRPTRCTKGRTAFHLGRKLVGHIKAAEDGDRSDKALSTLDSLLGSENDSGGPSSVGRDPALVEWWRIRPRQAAPPRTTSISSSVNPSGRFIANEEMLRNEVRAGRKTLPGQALELPKVVPYASYIIALIHAAVYGTLVRVYVTQGADATSELREGLELSRSAVVDQAEVWRLLSGCFVQADLLGLAVVLYGMLVVSPRVEASLGYRTFMAAYVLSAMAAADVLLALTAASGDTVVAATQTAAAAAAGSGLPAGLLEAMMHPGSHDTLAGVVVGDPGAVYGGLGAAMGLAGSTVAHQLINGDVERQASGSSSGSTGRGAGGGRGDLGEGGGAAAVVGLDAVRTGVLLAGAAAVVLQHVLDPGGAALVASLGAGFGTAGPRYQVTREVELPDGSMWIPDPDLVTEVTVVLDQTTSIQRTLATATLAAVVSIATIVVLFG
ncbi:hypothetical protein VOLCADRAFT_89379, partial [Volvox carteri f. nagariensis]